MDVGASQQQTLDRSGVVFFCVIVFVLASLTKTFHQNNWIAFEAVSFGFGVVVGYLNHNYDSFQWFIDANFLEHVSLSTVVTSFVTPIALCEVFSMDARALVNSSKTIIATILCQYVLNVLLHGGFIAFVSWLLEKPFDPISFCLFGFVICQTNCMHVKMNFIKLGRFHSVRKYLEAEALITNGMGFGCYLLLMSINIAPFEFVASGKIVLFIVGNVLLGPIIGFLFARLVLLWLRQVYTDVILEVVLCISMTFLAFYLCHFYMQTIPVVGLVTVFVFGLVLNIGRGNFSPGVDAYFEQFLNIVRYMLVVLLYTMAGYIIAIPEFVIWRLPSNHMNAIMLLVICLYGYSVLARAVSISLMFPFLHSHFERPTWHEVAALVVCVTGHPLSVLIAIETYDNGMHGVFDHGDKHSTVGTKKILQHAVILFIIIVTILKVKVHGSGMNIWFMLLAMKRVSLVRQVAMSKVLQNIRGIINTSVVTYQSDRFLADADWVVVYEFVNFDKFFQEGSMFHHQSVLDSAMSPDSDIVAAEEAKLLILHAKKISYCRQYEHGMLSFEAMRIVLDRVEALQRENLTMEDYLSSESIQQMCNVDRWNRLLYPKIILENSIAKQKRMVDDCMKEWKARRSLFRLFLLRLVTHQYTSYLWDFLIVSSFVTTLLLVIYIHQCTLKWNFQLMTVLLYEVNLAIISLATFLFFSKVLLMFNKKYLTNGWTVFRMLQLAQSWTDVGIFYGLRWPVDSICRSQRGSTNLTVIDVVCDIFICLRLIRVINFIQQRFNLFLYLINEKMQSSLRLSYDIGKGYVKCQDDVVNAIDELIGSPLLAAQIKEMLTTAKARMMSELASLQKTHPGIVMSVKSQHASRRLLSSIEDEVLKMRKEGMLDEMEAKQIDRLIKIRWKKVLNIPALLPLPQVEKILRLSDLIDGDEMLIDYLQFNSHVIALAEGDSLSVESGAEQGIYIVLSGLVRVPLAFEEVIESHPTRGNRWSKHTINSMTKEQVRTFEMNDYLTTGMSFGELSLLTQEELFMNCVCDTTVQLLHIPYETITIAMQLFNESPKPDSTLKDRLWRSAGIHTSHSMLRGLSDYRHLSLEDFVSAISRGTVEGRDLSIPMGTVDAAYTDTFNLTPFQQKHDVLLVYGYATSEDGKLIFTSQCIIPPWCEVLLLSPAKCDQLVLFVVPHLVHSSVDALGNSLNATSPEGDSHSRITASSVGAQTAFHAMRHNWSGLKPRNGLIKALPRTQAQRDLYEATKRQEKLNYFKRKSAVADSIHPRFNNLLPTIKSMAQVEANSTASSVVTQWPRRLRGDDADTPPENSKELWPRILRGDGADSVVFGNDELGSVDISRSASDELPSPATPISLSDSFHHHAHRTEKEHVDLQPRFKSAHVALQNNEIDKNYNM